MESGKNFQFPHMIESNAKISFPSISYNEEKRQAGISKKAAVSFLLDTLGSVIVTRGTNASKYSKRSLSFYGHTRE